MSASSPVRSAGAAGFAGAGELFYLVFALALVAAVLAGLCAGRLAIPVHTVVAIPFGKLGLVPTSWSILDERVVLLVRAPRVLMAGLAGAGLAMSGAALQGIFRNPLVSPQILGISGGAAFGGALSLLLGVGGFVLVGSAFLWGMIALLLVGLIAQVGGRAEQAIIVLAGIVVGALFTALVSLVQFLADPNSSLPAIVGWLMGSFATVTWQRVGLTIIPILVGCGGLLALRFRINILSLGADEARSFGARVGRERWIVFALVGLLTGAVIAVAGIVAWVGLVVPHAARLLVGPDHRRLVPASALLGAAYLIVIDTLARTLTAAEIPLGVLTAIVGAPVFALLLRASFVRQERP